MEENTQCPIIIIDSSQKRGSYDQEMIQRIAENLRQEDYEVCLASSGDDGIAWFQANPNTGCLIVNWDMKEASRTIRTLRSNNKEVPIFLVADRSEFKEIKADIIQAVSEYVWKREDTTDFITGRICRAVKQYTNDLMPPFFKALANFAQTYEYSWHTPGHTGGTAFLKSPVGKAFFEFFGEQLFRSDLSVSVGELGSLLDHTGPCGEAESYAARVFQADMTFFVTNGTSTANRIVFQGCVVDGDYVVIDRNCHKSICQGMILTGAIPHYLTPTRNAYGIIGPIPSNSLTPDYISRRLAMHPLQNLSTRAADSQSALVKHGVITNSTYDGLCYEVSEIMDKVGTGVERMHFDEAWYSYAAFNPIYKGRFAMGLIPPSAKTRKGPTVFATQSTHKLLAALSQASMIHIKNGNRGRIDRDLFNEAFMMHGSTSPQYAIIASNDVSSAMMDGDGGPMLTRMCIREAVDFRQTMARLYRELTEGEHFSAQAQPNVQEPPASPTQAAVQEPFGLPAQSVAPEPSAAQGRWWFKVWQPDNLDAIEPEALVRDPRYWCLDPHDSWHGFKELKESGNRYCMLDPIKVTLITPGIKIVDYRPEPEEFGIPAPIVTAYLDSKGIIVEKTGDYTMLFLFSLGITKGKWGTLIDALFDFKRHYDLDTPLAEVLPDIVAKAPEYYNGKFTGLRDLCQKMHEFKSKNQMLKKLATAFQFDEDNPFPNQALRPLDAYRKLVENQVDLVSLEEIKSPQGLERHTLAVMVVPYPPGIPILMPGEELITASPAEKAKIKDPTLLRLIDKTDQIIDYLLSLQDFDNKFPGFEHDIHGNVPKKGEKGTIKYYTYCVRTKSSSHES